MEYLNITLATRKHDFSNNKKNKDQKSPKTKKQSINPDSTQLQETIMPTPHFFQVKFIKQLNKYQNHMLGDKKRNHFKMQEKERLLSKSLILILS